jgi:hypothetical protein
MYFNKCDNVVITVSSFQGCAARLAGGVSVKKGEKKKKRKGEKEKGEK